MSPSRTHFVRVLLTVVLLTVATALTACGSGVRRRPGADTDGGTTTPIDSGALPMLDGGVAGFDSGTIMFDGGRPGFDGGRPGFDGGRPGFDGGRPGFDAGRPRDGGMTFPTPDGGPFPFGDASLPFCTSPAECPPGQMCCELLPGTGFGMCGVTCTGGFP